ncbi:unnamed protein product [Phytophthora lilii]|uniref:Unnamed protein product n=1 Tax=Phytophthora lilii TaxID=2077276 RepID=A0A9W6XHJ2_9STRA|nr:unnamed protein product [Phytophthora lilii]
MMAMLGLMLMVLVTVVSLVLTWNSEDDENSFVELPMFQPLMWIAVGIFSGGVTGFYEGRSNQERSSSGSDKAYLQK